MKKEYKNKKYWLKLYKEYENNSLLFLAKKYYCHTATIKKYFIKYDFRLRTKQEAIEKRKQTCLKRYGTECSLQNEQVKEKIKQTNLQKYGCENVSQNEQIKEKKKQSSLKKYKTNCPLQNEQIKEKIKQTNLKRYGYKNVGQNEQIKEKIKETNLKKYGTEYGFQNKEIKKKIDQTNLKRYGTKHPAQNKQIKEKTRQVNLKKYGLISANQSSLVKEKKRQTRYKKSLNKFKILYPDYELLDEYKGQKKKDDKWIEYNFKCLKCGNIFLDYFYSDHPRCLDCNPYLKGSSQLEQIFYDFIKNILGINNIEKNVKMLYDSETKYKKEIDIYLPDYKIGFEINGLYYHNSDPKSDSYKDKYYHTLKQQLALEQGIKLFHIWETKNINIYKSIIRNLLGKIENKIYARKCIIKKVNKQNAEIFLVQNHINGYAISSKHFGLYYQNKLVSIICFRKNEISRFCSKLDTIVIGAFNKLLKYSLKELNYKSIITYCDKEFCIQPEDSVYYKNSFSFIKQTEPKLYYTDFKQIFSRQKFMKHKLRDMKGYDEQLTANEILSLNGIYPMYSVGNFKFELKM